jgi:REP element-mobilizing transposase RayT
MECLLFVHEKAACAAGAVPSRWQAPRRGSQTGPRAGERHAARPDFKPHHALHVVMRVAPSVGSLRCRRMYKAMREATITAALRERFRIVHVSLQRSHVHLIVEAEHKAALARGMQGFAISAARHVTSTLALRFLPGGGHAIALRDDARRQRACPGERRIGLGAAAQHAFEQ